MDTKEAVTLEHAQEVFDKTSYVVEGFYVKSDKKLVKVEQLSDIDYLYGVREPRKGCKKCYDRGFEGWNAATGKPILCRCLFRKNGPLMTFGELKSIEGHTRTTGGTNGISPNSNVAGDSNTSDSSANSVPTSTTEDNCICQEST
jgi:hypothetical protein